MATVELLAAQEIQTARTRKGRRQRPSILIILSVVVLALVAVAAALGTLIAPHDPAAQDLGQVYATPSGAHLLGTDELGRDLLSRLIAGTRSALIGPLIVTLLATAVGNVAGLYAGYKGGWADALLMRTADLAMAIPSQLVIIVVAGILGGGYWSAVALLTLIMAPGDARVARGATLAQAQRPYIEAARTLGVSQWRIMVQHIWPNISATVVANAAIGFAASLVSLGTLSFLGVGASPVVPDWGVMLSAGEASLFQNPVATLAPGVAIVLLAGSMNLIGDWAYDKISTRAAGR